MRHLSSAMTWLMAAGWLVACHDATHVAGGGRDADSPVDAGAVDSEAIDQAFGEDGGGADGGDDWIPDDAGVDPTCRPGPSYMVGCGYNGSGRAPARCVLLDGEGRPCVEGQPGCVWQLGEFGACADPDACVADATRTVWCGLNERGEAEEQCVQDGESAPYTWHGGSCDDPDECRDGETAAIACGGTGDGRQQKICVEGRWASRLPCEDPTARCRPRSTETVACGINGRGLTARACNDDGFWGPFDPCDDPDVCVDGSQGSRPCGPCRDGRQRFECVEGQVELGGECEGGCCDPAEYPQVLPCDEDEARVVTCVGGEERLSGCRPTCTATEDCRESGGICEGELLVCTVPTCDDHRQNGDERGVDCGGPCPPCEEAVEVCDGRDQDLDGEVDEDTGSAIPCGDPLCAGRQGGHKVCVEGRLVVECAEARIEAEVCNGVDDDCDGAADDGLELRERCPGGGARVLTCVDGEWDGDAECQCVPDAEVAEACDGFDNDCDGELDEGFGTGEACSEGVGACRRVGITYCAPNRVACSALPGAPSEEACNREDDDCDGSTDEGVGRQGGCIVDGAPGQRPEVCIDGAFVPDGPCEVVDCTPVPGGDDLGCGPLGDRPICDESGPVDTCRGCQSDDECPFARPICLPGGRCAACDPDDGRGCAGQTPVCDRVDLDCRACAADAECTGGQCLADGRCAMCDPSDHAGCGPDALCCAQGGESSCVAKSLDGCEACGQACDPRGADLCAARGCSCGAGPACSGETPFCIAGECQACAADADCPRDQACVDGRCAGCDPETGAGCDVTGDRPYCDPDALRCVSCDNDDARCPADRPYCLGDTCERCDPSDNRGCDPASDRPFCDPARSACVSCGLDSLDDRRCVDRDLPECVAGACRACDPRPGEGNAGCDAASDAPVCEVVEGAEGREATRCRGCSNDGECGRRPCVDGRCVVCDPLDHTGCEPDELCCGEGPAAVCVPTDARDGCEACGVGCGLGGDVCVGRRCGCGGAAACDGGAEWLPSDRVLNVPGSGAGADLRADGWCFWGSCFGRTTVAHRGQTVELDVREGGWRGARVGEYGFRYRSEYLSRGKVWRLSLEPTVAGDPTEVGAIELTGRIDFLDEYVSSAVRETALDGVRLSFLEMEGDHYRVGGELFGQDTALHMLVPSVPEQAERVSYEASVNPVVRATRVRLPVTYYLAATNDSNGDGSIQQALINNIDLEGQAGDAPYCVDGQCTECEPRDDLGCGEALSQCIGGTCRACDPVDNAGCDATRPLCSPEAFVCRPCAQDAHCNAFPEQPLCVDGQCAECDPTADGLCGADEWCVVPDVAPVCFAEASCEFNDNVVTLSGEQGSEVVAFDTRQQPGVVDVSSYDWDECGSDSGGRSAVFRLVLRRRARVAIDVIEADYEAEFTLRADCDGGARVSQTSCGVDWDGASPALDIGILEAGVYFLLVGGDYEGPNRSNLGDFNTGTGRVEITLDYELQE